jgi:3-methyladenine DNA glycosylase AlkD
VTPTLAERVRRLRAAFRRAGDPAHAELHRAYHKSPRRFHGLRTEEARAIVREVFPRRPGLTLAETRQVADALWRSDWFEERGTAIGILARVAGDLTVGDLPRLRRMTHGCDGWGLLDGLAVDVLGPLALSRGRPVYRAVRTWSKDRDLWTRRASILVHVRPARVGRLEAAWAWPTFEELLPERDFFVRKAIGWALRECTKRYPREVHAFLVRVGDRASGLTRREGARNLPPALRRRVLGR